MTQTFGTTAFPANDIYLLPNGNVAILQGQSAVEAACQSTSLLRLGEAILQTTLGIPYFQAVWAGVPNLSVYESYLRNAITSVNGVVGIQSLTISVSQGTLSYTATIESVYGEIYLTQEIPLS
jgi:hypothetical protein